MEALKALADTNVKIGEIKGVLTKLKEEEATYLSDREAKTVKHVQKVLKDSEDALNKAFSNYEEIKKFASETTEFAAYLHEAQEDFQILKDTFDAYTKAWADDIKTTENMLLELKEQVKLDQEKIDSEKKKIAKDWDKVAEEKKKLKDERETLDRAIARLKEKRV